MRTVTQRAHTARTPFLHAALALIAGVLASPAIRAQLPPLHGGQLAELSLAEGRLIETALPDHLTGEFVLPIQLDGVPRVLVLEPHSVRGPRFQVLEQGSDGLLRPVDAPAPRTVRGHVEGLPGSFAAGSLANGRLELVLRAGRDGDLFGIDPLADGRHALYRHQAVVAPAVLCGNDAVSGAPPALPTHAGGAEGGEDYLVCDLALDADHEYYLFHNGDTDAVVQDLEGIVASCAAIYTSDFAIGYRINELIVRASEMDPYTGTLDSVSLLDQFRSHWTSNHNEVDRDLAHLFTGRTPFAFILGVAYIDQVCNKQFGYGLSASRVPEIATYVLRVALTAHELGHNWSSPHCDGSPDCEIMAAAINPFADPADFPQQFGAVAEGYILNKKNTVSCLEVGVLPTIPVLDAVFPSFGLPEGGEIMEVYGSDLPVDPPPSVSVGGSPAELVTSSDSLITLVVPPGTPGKVVDIVATGGNGVALLEDAYRYELSMTPGDDVTSSFTPQETERFYFDGLAGERFTAKLIPADPSGNLIAGIRLIGPGEEQLVEIEGTVPKKGKPVSLVKFELPATGSYRLDVYAIGITEGDYTLKTKSKPQRKLKTNVAVAPGEGAEPGATVTFAAPADALLKLAHFKRRKPKGDFATVDGVPSDLTPTILSLTGPSGPIDIDGLVQFAKKGKWARIKKLPLPETGDYTLELGGLDASVGHGILRVKLKTPKTKGETFELD